jgi:hypothetical protein
MSIDEFDSLGDQEKAYLLWKQGIFLSNIQRGNNIWDTYKLEDFQVSVCINLIQHENIFYVSYCLG